MSLRNERVAELEALQDAFQTTGFKLYQSELLELYEARRNTAIQDCDTGAKWMERRGELLAYARVIGYVQNAEQELETMDEQHFPDEPEPENRNPLED